MKTYAELYKGTNPDIPLLRKIVEWAETEEKLTKDREWYQGAWVRKETYPVVTGWGAEEDYVADETQQRPTPWCKTTMCIAGKIALDAGWKPTLDTESNGSDGEVEGMFGRAYYADFASKDGQSREIRSIACSELGITLREAFRLFEGGNDAADIRQFAEELAGERL